jgi:hypothetical protein
MHTAAAKQVEKNGFRLILLMVRGGYRSGSDLGGHREEEPVTFPARRLFDPYAGVDEERRRIEKDHADV